MKETAVDALVTTEWLANEIGAADLRVVDATWFMPGEGDAASTHEATHIPGAVFMDLAELADTTTDVPMMLPPAEKFVSRVQSLGLGDRSRIVIYDNSPYRSATRAWWTLRMFGVREVAILDGGFAKWQVEGRETASGRETPPNGNVTVRASMAGVRDLAAIKANVDSGAEQVIDARSPARFTGEESDPRPGTAAGHIPRSRNLHYKRLFNDDGTWKRGEALRGAFTDAGIDPTRPIVATCGSGVTAAVLVFGAHLLGNDAALYDGSWAEWGRDPSTQKAVGPA